MGKMVAATRSDDLSRTQRSHCVMSRGNRKIAEVGFSPIFSEENIAHSSPQPVRVLVIDDDEPSRHSLASCLEQHAMRVVTALQKRDVRRELSAYEPSIVILGRCQGGDGFELLREIRLRSNVPVIIADGHGGNEIDCVVGLELGADDYVLKPFSGHELFARIRAVLRGRQRGSLAIQKDPARRRYRFGGWMLDRRARRLTTPDCIPIDLTKGEFALLVAFLDAPRRPLSREYLLQATRIQQEDVFDRCIDVQVLRLRRKLEPDPSAPRIIQTERGVGYTFALPVETL
jgi:two-component system, OmpR family, response regulator